MSNDDKWKKYKKDGEDVKEFFCGACLAVPLAFVGVGASAYGASSRGSHKKSKKIVLWSGIATIIISLIIAIYYLTSCTNCR